MAIILDTDGFSGKTYLGCLEKILFGALAAAQPQNRFVCTTATEIQQLAPNISAADFPAQRGLFHQKKTEKWLQQHDASAFISFKKMLKITRPLTQMLIIAGEELLNDEKAIHSATRIGIVSVGLNQLFNQTYPGISTKSFLIEGITGEKAQSHQLITDDIREIIASGREYFILADFNCTQEKLTTLLKGFSAFKRMLHSSWKLMVVLRSEETIKRADIEQLLSNYKYREDVMVTDESLLNEKIRDAYALISMDGSEKLPIPVIEAARTHTPVIAPATVTLKQVYGEAIAYAENNTSEAIGEMLMKMYKDENFRQTLKKRLENRSSTPGQGNILSVLTGVLHK